MAELSREHHTHQDKACNQRGGQEPDLTGKKIIVCTDQDYSCKLGARHPCSGIFPEPFGFAARDRNGGEYKVGVKDEQNSGQYDTLDYADGTGVFVHLLKCEHAPKLPPNGPEDKIKNSGSNKELNRNALT